MARKPRARGTIQDANPTYDLSGPFDRLTSSGRPPVTGGEPLRPLMGLGRVLEALDAFVLTTRATPQAGEDVVGRHGDKVETPDLERDPANPDSFTRRPGNTGKRPDCDNSVIVEWRAYYVTSDISDTAQAAALQAQLPQAIAAAKKLCTDPKCPDALVTVTYTDVGYKRNTNGQAAKGNGLFLDDYIIRVVIQLEVRCRLLL